MSFFLCVGDDLQLEGINNIWLNKEVPFENLLKSDMLKLMCPNRIILTKNKRSDAVIHDFVTRCRTGNLNNLLKEAREKFTYPGPFDLELCISNSQRKHINVVKNKREGICLRGETTMYLYPGLELIGCLPVKRNNIVNGILYTVISCDANNVKVSDGAQEYTVTTCFAGSSFRLAFSRTIFQSQSMTAPGSVCIHTRNSHFNKRHLLVAVSRCKDHKN